MILLFLYELDDFVIYVHFVYISNFYTIVLIGFSIIVELYKFGFFIIVQS